MMYIQHFQYKRQALITNNPQCKTIKINHQIILLRIPFCLGISQLIYNVRGLYQQFRLQYSMNRTQKAQKIRKLFIQNNIERDNHTLVLRLKKKIEELNNIIQSQQNTIQCFKKDVKTTKINQMEIQIQHLNDENKRLLLIIDELRGKSKSSNLLSPKKTMMNSTKFQERRPIITQIKIDNKVYEVLKENQILKKQLVNLKINENLLKKRKSTLNDRSSIFIEKNLIDYEKLYQKKIDLEAEKVVMVEKMKNLENKIVVLIKRNEQLQKIHHRHIAIEFDLIQ